MADSVIQKNIDFKSEYAYIGVIVAMLTIAKNLGVRSGVAVFLVEKSRPDGISNFHYQAIDRMFYGRGGNHFCSAMAMIGTMKALHTSTGNTADRLMAGETTKKGGLLKVVDGYSIYVAFDGDCSEVQNLEIAKAGMAMLFPDEENS